MKFSAKKILPEIDLALVRPILSRYSRMDYTNLYIDSIYKLIFQLDDQHMMTIGQYCFLRNDDNYLDQVYSNSFLFKKNCFLKKLFLELFLRTFLNLFLKL